MTSQQLDLFKGFLNLEKFQIVPTFLGEILRKVFKNLRNIALALILNFSHYKTVRQSYYQIVAGHVHHIAVHDYMHVPLPAKAP